MKYGIIFFCAFMIGFCACSKEDDIETVAFFEPLSEDTLWYGAADAVQVLPLKAGGTVEAVVDGEAAVWCSAEISGTGSGQAVTVHCSQNEKVEIRYTTILLKISQIERKLVIAQLGAGPVLKAVKTTFELSTDSLVVSVPVISNVHYEVVPGDNWIHYLEVVKGENADTLKLAVGASIYPRRSAEVQLKWENLSQTLSITQISSDTIYHPEDGGSLMAQIKVVDGEASHESPQALFSKSYDGMTTLYVAPNVPVTENVTMTWYFEQPEELGEMGYVSGADDPARTLGEFNVFVREEGSTDFKALGKFDFEHRMSTSVLKFDRSLKKVDAVRIEALPPKEAVRPWVLYVEEMTFYSRSFDVTAIFTDELCSDLKESVTYEQIYAIEDEFYRNIARSMYMGTYEKEFRVSEYRPYINPNIQKQKHKAFAWSFLDNPTGISVEDGQKVVVFAGDPGDEVIKICIIDYNTATSSNLKPELTAFQLKEGINVFTANKTGLMYVLYNPDDTLNKQPVKIHIPSGKVNGYFDIRRHNNSDWTSLLQKAENKFLDVKGKLSHLVFPTEDFRRYCRDNIERLVEVYDSIVLLEHQLAGLYKRPEMYPNRILYKVTYEESAYMYAYHYQTAYHYLNAVPQILNAEGLRKDVWGVAHETGHVHQNRDITWRGMTEVSNNVFALYVQTTFGNESRLIKEDRYQQAYDSIVIPGLPHGLPGMDNPFAKVVPLWQLHLYFAKVLHKPEFYMDLYQKMREESTPACPQLNFVELCCKLGGIDFTDFFRFHGFLTPINAKVEDSVDPGLLRIEQSQIDKSVQAIEAMGLSKAPVIQYLTDDNIALFKTMKPVVAGRVNVSGAAITLTGWENVVAWEVYDGDRLIQISLKNTFNLKNTGASVTVKAVAADGTKTIVKLV